MISDFNHILSLIANHSSLIVPNIDDCLCLACDASSRGVGGVLSVCRNGADLPVAYFSRQTKTREEKYSATELECLAVVESLEHFKAYLIGKHFKLYTDHSALKSLLTSTNLNSRLWRWALKVQDYDMKIYYRKGKDNVIPDALSRQGWELRGSPQQECVNHVSTTSSLPATLPLEERGSVVDPPTQQHPPT